MIFYILSECRKFAQCNYKKRHGKVAQKVHENICQKFQRPYAKSWFDRVAGKMTESNNAKALQNFTIQTVHMISARKPDTVVLDKEMEHTSVIDIAVPSVDGRVKEKEMQKKYKKNTENWDAMESICEGGSNGRGGSESCGKFGEGTIEAGYKKE